MTKKGKVLTEKIFSELIQNVLKRILKRKYQNRCFVPCNFFSWDSAIFAEKRLSPRKKILHGKKFRFRDFRFKIRFKTFWIDCEKKFFLTKIFKNFHILVIFCQKWRFLGHFRVFLGRNKKNVFCKPFAQFYCGHFKPSFRCLGPKMCK